MKVYLLLCASICFIVGSRGRKFEEKRFWNRENVFTYREEHDVTRWIPYPEHCESIKTKCPDKPLLECRMERCEKTERPVVHTEYTIKHRCRPGWSTRQSSWQGILEFHFMGCTNFSSCYTLPQYTPEQCKKERQKELIDNGYIYHLTTPATVVPSYPVTDTNIADFLTFPVYNITSQQAIGMALSNADEKQWAKVYLGMIKRNAVLAARDLQNPTVFDDYQYFSDILVKYQRGQHDGTFQDKYFRFPSLEGDFKDLRNVWREDQVFVEKRLAGLNPMSIRKLRLEEYQEMSPNFSPGIDAAVSKAVVGQTTLRQMVERETVYILDYPLLRNVTNSVDITDRNRTDRREMRSSLSPVAFFVSVPDWSGKYGLRPVAIQHGLEKSSPLVTPTDGSKWLLAKEEVERADVVHVELIEHLLKSHLLMGVICVTMHRTLPSYHPLHEIFKWHCRGILMTNVLGLPSLVKPAGQAHTLFSVGPAEAIEMLNKGHAEFTWDETDFVKSLERRGLDKKETLPYFPYRDDGLLVWDTIKAFATKYVQLYYKNKDFVQQDKELQNFANELSADGQGKYGGVGMVNGFPRKISSRSELVDVVTRIVFLPVQHHAVNYPVAYYGGFVPSMPGKLYDDPRVQPDEFNIHRLPESHYATLQVALAMNLGTLRFDKLFDYGGTLNDTTAGSLVDEAYKTLGTKVHEVIIQRNKQRIKEGHLAYPYFKVGLIPNSIHT